MNALFWQGNSLKLLGKTIFKLSLLRSHIVYKVLGVPFFARKSSIAELIYQIKQNEDFDTRELDKKIEFLVVESCKVKFSKTVRKNRIIYLASELYEDGGHTKCLREYASVLSEDFLQAVFLTRYTSTKIKNKSTLDVISKNANIYGKELNLYNWKKQIITLYNEICEYSPKVIFVFIHPNDIYGAMLLALIKKYTNIGIVYYPHASHYPNLGMNFSDLSLHNLPSTAKITREIRKFSKTHVFGLVSKRISDFPNITAQQISEQKKIFGINPNEVCVMAGGAAYKFFDADGTSKFFQTVKKIMELRPNVRVVIMANFNSEQISWIGNVFSSPELRTRLILTKTTPAYELNFSCADVFLDSFPVSAALTMVDLMRLKVPYVVKINRQNPFWSFHEYQKEDYPYMFEEIDDFIVGALKLIDNESERRRIVKMNYEFYLSKYEGNAGRLRLCQLINNYQKLSCYID